MTDARSDWQVPVAAPAFDPASLRASAAEFDRQIRWRNLREYGAAALVVAMFGYWACQAHGPLERAGALLIAAAAIFVSLVIGKRGVPAQPPVAEAATDLLRHWQAELQKQADLLADVRRWYIGPFLPGFALILVARMAERPGVSLAVSLTGAIIGALGIAIGLWIVDRLNRDAAADLRRTIADLQP